MSWAKKTAETDHDYSYKKSSPSVVRVEQHAINTTFKYAYVKHNLPKPLTQVYIWKKSRSPYYEFLALEGESG